MSDSYDHLPFYVGRTTIPDKTTPDQPTDAQPVALNLRELARTVQRMGAHGTEEEIAEVIASIFPPAAPAKAQGDAKTRDDYIRAAAQWPASERTSKLIDQCMHLEAELARLQAALTAAETLGRDKQSLIIVLRRDLDAANARADAMAEKCAKVCDEIADDLFRQYKGRAPHAPMNPHRADPHTQGQSDGAGLCAQTIRDAAKGTP